MKQTDALLLINAYRLGSVPAALHYPSVTRPELFKAQEHFLNQLELGIPQLLLIEGTYGAGKTHALHDMAFAANQSNFAVATITLESNMNLLKPELLYYNIMHHLTVKGKLASFEDIFSLWIDNLKHAPSRQVAASQLKWVTDEMARHHEAFANGFTQYIRAALVGDYQTASRIAAWLQGDPTLAPGIHRKLGIKGSVDRLRAFDFLKAFSKLLQLIGYSGLIVLIDELDLVTKLRSDQREMAYGTLRHLIDEQIAGAFGAFGLVISGTPISFRDEDLGIKSYSPLAQRLGFDPPNTYNQEPLITLHNSSLEVLYQLSTHLLQAYALAYGQQPLTDPQVVAHLVLMDLKKGITNFYDIPWRYFIQSFLGLLDSIRKKPHQKILQMSMTLQIGDDGTMHFKNRLRS